MRVTGPSVALRRRVRIRSEPLLPGSTLFSRLFFTANPTPCYLCSSELFPCQKKGSSFSFSVPESARHVSCRAAMFTFSLLSLLLMTAVFLALLMSWRFCDRPGSMVRTLQHPSLKVGLFLVVLHGVEFGACSGLDVGFFLVVLHGVEFEVCSELKVAVGLFLVVLLMLNLTSCHSDFVLTPRHPLEIADRDGTTLFWLGAAQLEAGGSCPLSCNDFSHQRKQPLAPRFTPI